MPPATWQEGFARFPVPRRPLAADDFELGVYPVAREIALNYRYIQFNPPARHNWLTIDIDRPDAAHAWEAASVVPPTFVIENPQNGYAHFAWRLAAPVSYFERSHHRPVAYLADIQRGFTRRLGADRAYCGLLTKNPLHSDWRVSRPFEGAYSLGELARVLKREEMRQWEPGEREAGLGRNCALFDWLSATARKEVLRLKREGASYADFLQDLLGAALALNRTANFHRPLIMAKSTASRNRWPAGPGSVSARSASAIQSWRGTRGMASRWKDHVSLDVLKPWEAENCSRRTWFYRQRAALRKVRDLSSNKQPLNPLYPDMVIVQPITVRVRSNMECTGAKDRRKGKYLVFQKSSPL